MPTVIFDAAETVTVSYLNTVLPKAGFQARASTKIRDPRPAEFVRIERLGSSRISLVQERVRILVECYGKDDMATDRLARYAHALLLGIEADFVGSTWVYSCTECAGIVDNFDLERQLPRRQFEVYLTIRGDQLTL